MGRVGTVHRDWGELVVIVLLQRLQPMSFLLNGLKGHMALQRGRARTRH